MDKKNFFKEHNVRIRSISNLVGVMALFCAGLFFVLFIDLKAKPASSGNIIPLAIWLLFAIIFAVGGGIFYFIGDTQKHKKVLTLVLKGIGIVLAIGFIAFIFYFLNWVNTKELIQVEAVHTVKTVANVSLIISIIGIISVIFNYVLSIIFVDEDY